MLDPQGAFFIRDHQLVSASEETKIPAESLLIYEVVRIVDAACLFCQEHFNRLKFSSKLAGIQLNISEEEFQSDLQQLIEANNCKEGNVKILLQYHKGTQVYYFYSIPHSYPSLDEYKHGVNADFLKAERLEPQVKIVQENLRNRANQFIQENGLYDAILVNSRNQVLEGSRTNVFLVRGKEFYTSPAEHVLSGITREKVMACLHELGYSCFEKEIDCESIADFDAVFFTGTSPKILPVAKIGKHPFNVDHKPLRELMLAYDELVVAYLREVLSR